MRKKRRFYKTLFSFKNTLDLKLEIWTLFYRNRSVARPKEYFELFFFFGADCKEALPLCDSGACRLTPTYINSINSSFTIILYA